MNPNALPFELRVSMAALFAAFSLGAVLAAWVMRRKMRRVAEASNLTAAAEIAGLTARFAEREQVTARLRCELEQARERADAVQTQLVTASSRSAHLEAEL